MNHPGFGFKLGLCALVLGVSGWANASCYIGSIANGVVTNETNATGVQSDSGNGTYNCTVVSTANGTLAPVTGNYFSIVNGKVNWSVPVNESGYPTVDVDLVSVASNSGKRCNYSYANQSAGGVSLTTSDGSAAKYVTICSDGVIAPEPPSARPEPPPLITTLGYGCSAPFTYEGSSPNGTKFDVAIGYSKQFFYKEGQNPETEDPAYEGAAICANGSDKQHECVNECVPHTPTGACTAAADGTLPLSCRSCEYESDTSDLKYCWYYENHVNVDAGTFKPSPKKKSLSAQIDVTTGSNCYTITIGPLYGGKMSTIYQCQ
jgi:hypothetical protein